MSSRIVGPEAIRAYAARDWARLRESKRAYWRARMDRGGLDEAVRVTELLRDPHEPSETSREEDLQTHQRVAEALARTPRYRARARARRARRVR